MNDGEPGTSRGAEDFDVFLNYSRPWKSSFVADLEDALQCAGHCPFLDARSLMKENPALQSIDQALAMAKVHVAVVSTEYAESTNCLNELVAMVNSGKPVVPVFYGVEPKDLQWVEDGPFAAAFKRHKSKWTSPEEVQQWRDALAMLSRIPGFRLADYGSDESNLKQDVVYRVARLTRSHIPVELGSLDSMSRHIQAGRRLAAVGTLGFLGMFAAQIATVATSVATGGILGVGVFAAVGVGAALSMFEDDWERIRPERRNANRESWDEVDVINEVSALIKKKKGDTSESQGPLRPAIKGALRHHRFPMDMDRLGSLSLKQKQQEKPKIYLLCHSLDIIQEELEEHFHLRKIEECNLGVVIISMSSLTSITEMVDLVRMVEEAKRRRDFKILAVMLDMTLAELDGLKIREHIRNQWDQIEATKRIHATKCVVFCNSVAAAYEYTRSCCSIVNIGLKYNEFLKLVFDRIHALTSTERNTENLRGIAPPISMKDSDTVRSSEIYKSTSVNDPDSKNLGGERKNESAVESVSDKGYTKETGFLSMSSRRYLLLHGINVQNAPLEDTKSISTFQNKIVEQDSDDVSTDEYDTSMDEGRESLLDEVKKMNISQPNIDEDQISEDGYEVFKNEIYEDIMKIDGIQELAIDNVDIETLLLNSDTIILSFSDERKETFEFYFKSREDMARIVGVGLKHAKVALEGEEVTIKEIMEEDWNHIWRTVTINSSGTMKLFKMKRESPSNVYEKLTHLDVEVSTRKPLLWELTKYFSLKETIATFATKEMYAKCASGGEASSSSSSNNGVQLFARATWEWVKDKIPIGETPSDVNQGVISNQLEEQVMDSFKNRPTTVKLQLLNGGRIVEKYGSRQAAQSCYVGEIVPNLEFTFSNEGEGNKMIHIIVGEISFKFARDEDGYQSNWYHNKFRVIFGILDEEVQRYGLLERQTLKHLNMSSGKYDTKNSCTLEARNGKERQTNVGGSVTGGVPVFKGTAIAGKAWKTISQAASMNLKEKSHERTCEDTVGGLFVKDHVEDHRIICDYYLPEESTPSLEPIPSQEYVDQGVKFEGTWIPQESSPQFVDYTLRATRDLQDGGCKKIKYYEQNYKTKILVNHSMSHLDGKTYKIRVWKNPSDGEIRLTELNRETKWHLDLLKVPARDRNIRREL